MTSAPFERVAGLCAMLVAMTGFLYAIGFTGVSRVPPTAGMVLSAAFLVLGGLLTMVVQVALYQRLRQTDSSWALLAFVLGLVGAVTHGGMISRTLSIRRISALPNLLRCRARWILGV